MEISKVGSICTTYEPLIQKGLASIEKDRALTVKTQWYPYCQKEIEIITDGVKDIVATAHSVDDLSDALWIYSIR